MDRIERIDWREPGSPPVQPVPRLTIRDREQREREERERRRRQAPPPEPEDPGEGHVDVRV